MLAVQIGVTVCNLDFQKLAVPGTMRAFKVSLSVSKGVLVAIPTSLCFQVRTSRGRLSKSINGMSDQFRATELREKQIIDDLGQRASMMMANALAGSAEATADAKIAERHAVYHIDVAESAHTVSNKPS